MVRRLDRRRLVRIATAASAVFGVGLASSLSVFTPPAAPRSSDCTVACIPTTIPTLPTTIPPLPPPPTLPGTTTAPPTSPPPPASPVPPAAPPPATTTASPPATTPSTPPASPALAVLDVKVSVVGKGTRRFLVLRVDVNKAARARTALLRARTSVHRSAFELRAGGNVRKLRLPARLRPGRFTLQLVVRDGSGAALTLRRPVQVRQ